MSRRKDLERFLRRKQANPGYHGFRGGDMVTEPTPQALASVVCSVCGRKRNVAGDTVPRGFLQLRVPELPGSSLTEGG